MPFNVTIFTIFPDAFPGTLGISIHGKALSDGIWTLETVDLRPFGEGKHLKVDDTPAGGGVGMVLRADVLIKAFDAHIAADDDRPKFMMSPRGVVLTQGLVRELAAQPRSPLAGELSNVCETEGGLMPHHQNYPQSIKNFARFMRNEPTLAEKKIWNILRRRQTEYKFRRQFNIDGKFIVDFVCLEKRLIIEIDGGQHSDNLNDIKRTEYLEASGFKVIRFWNNDVLENIDGCYISIINALKENPSPHPLPQGEGELRDLSSRKGRRASSPFPKGEGKNGIILICGRYEGVDQRFLDARNISELSIGDYVLSGGEVSALVVLESVIRLLPNVMGKVESGIDESHSNELLEYPQYTRPLEVEGLKIPDVLLNGNHSKIKEWRKSQSEILTEQRRPDLWEKHLQVFHKN